MGTEVVRMGHVGEALKSQSLMGKQRSTMASNVWLTGFVYGFQTKDRFEHFSSVLILEVKDIVAIKLEKTWATYPFCMAAAGS